MILLLRHTICTILLVFTISFNIPKKEKTVFYIIGDSTVKNGDGKNTNVLQGWGSFIADYFDTTRITISNQAIGGRSSRTFITEGRWDRILAELKKGDYVIMQFGHNDGGALDDTARARGTIKGIGEDSVEIYNPIRKIKEVVHSYGWYMRKYVNEAKAKGAIPIVCSPIPRNDWKDGKVLRSNDTYTLWAKQVAEKNGAYFIDLHNLISDKLEKIGEKEAGSFFPQEHTHTNKAGAIFNAEIVVDQVKQLKSCKLKNYLLQGNIHSQARIDRKALVERHTIVNTRFDSLSSLSVGNGGFAITVDVTGLQSFPEAYARGVPLGTQSEWGWHSFIDTANYSFTETLKEYNLNGRNISYSVQLKEPERNKNAVNWFRQNPHRLQLGNLGFDIIKKDGSPAAISDIQNIHQTLNMWTGEIHSNFTVENIPAEVITFCHQRRDVIAVKINSALLNEGRMKIRVRLPSATSEWKDVGNNWNNEGKHHSTLTKSSDQSALITHFLDTTVYTLNLDWKGKAVITQKQAHYFLLEPSNSSTFEFGCHFTTAVKGMAILGFSETKSNNENQWKEFWQSGGAVDFSGSRDKRAFELERRIILSQYLTKIQCAGNSPPQETGLTYNSWYGKPHLEMHWWHGVHFSLWGRNELLEKSLAWYKNATEKARAIAKRQGYAGIRWQKMTDPEGRETPSSVGAFLIWQQPHIIYFSELSFREHKDVKTLEKYKDLVFATAEFMASYAFYDSDLKRFILGKGLIAAQERFRAEETFNPTYELVYWHWALQVAQQWKERLHLPRDKKWDEVINKLSPLPIQNDKYLFTESATDSYTNPEFRTDHPSVLGAWGMMPQTKMLDTSIMRHTFNWIWKNWSWNDTWGWDFPMVAMTATRMGLPEKAIDALLMPVQTNTYLNNGHNYQEERLSIYLPGNGGLLAAVALMCAGYDGCKIINPGIPKNGNWSIRWEGLKKML